MITRLHDGSGHLNVADTYIGAEEELTLINRPSPTILGKGCKVLVEVVGFAHVTGIGICNQIYQKLANRFG